jgi:methyl coenzyme M reductase beta subunit
VTVGRLTFLSHFVIILACAGASFFAYQRCVFQTVYANDVSMMTSAIAALFVVTAVWLGVQAWRADDGPIASDFVDHYRDVSPEFGHLAERLAVMFGFVGTAVGLSMQATSLAGGSTSFVALATSLFTTATGGVAAALIAAMTFNLEAGIRRRARA